MSDEEEKPYESWAYELNEHEIVESTETIEKPKRKKTGGRKAGTPNKATIRRFQGDYVSRTLTAAKCDPLESLVKIAQKAHKEGNLSVASKTYGQLLEYVVAKKREPIKADDLSSLVFSWQSETETKDIKGIVIEQEPIKKD